MILTIPKVIMRKINKRADNGFGECISEGIRSSCFKNGCGVKDLICGLWRASVNNMLSLRKNGEFSSIRTAVRRWDVLEILVSPCNVIDRFLLDVKSNSKHSIFEYGGGTVKLVDWADRPFGEPILEIYLCGDRRKLEKLIASSHSRISDVADRGVQNIYFFCREC